MAAATSSPTQYSQQCKWLNQPPTSPAATPSSTSPAPSLPTPPAKPSGKHSLTPPPGHPGTPSVSPCHHPRSTTTTNSPRQPDCTHPLPCTAKRHQSDLLCAHGPSITPGARCPPCCHGIPAPEHHHVQTRPDHLGSGLHSIGEHCCSSCCGWRECMRL